MCFSKFDFFSYFLLGISVTKLSTSCMPSKVNNLKYLAHVGEGGPFDLIYLADTSLNFKLITNMIKVELSKVTSMKRCYMMCVAKRYKTSFGPENSAKKAVRAIILKVYKPNLYRYCLYLHFVMLTSYVLDQK